MKHITLFLSVTFITLAIKAQTVTIPDANFKNYLLGNTAINTNTDTDIQTSEALAVTRLVLHGKSIADMTGIEAFTNLTYLDVDSNQITSLNLSANILLDTLACAHTPLTGIFDASTLTSLVRLYIPYNSNLTGFIAPTTSTIKWMDIGATAITSLDLSSQTDLEYLDVVLVTSLPSINLSNNRKLKTLLIALNAQITSLDVSLNDSLTTLLMTHFPGSAAVKTICVNPTQMAALPTASNWTKGAKFQYTTTGCLFVGMDEVSASSGPKKLLHIYNMLGQEVSIDETSEGVFFYIYSDGSVKKVANF